MHVVVEYIIPCPLWVLDLIALAVGYPGFPIDTNILAIFESMIKAGDLEVATSTLPLMMPSCVCVCVCDTRG